jgi:hypothetical protein
MLFLIGWKSQRVFEVNDNCSLWIRHTFSSITINVRLRLKCDDTREETRFRLSAKRTSPFKSAGSSVQSTTSSRGVRISGSNCSDSRYNMFRGSVKDTGYPLHSAVPPSLPLPCVTVCHHVSTERYECMECNRLIMNFLTEVETVTFAIVPVVLKTKPAWTEAFIYCCLNLDYVL